jgi:tetratricopeptide (TPR) repeat protein
MKRFLCCLLVVLALPLAAAETGGEREQDMSASLARLQKEWTQIQYQMPEDKKEDAFKALADKAGVLVEAFPERAEPHVWKGIILSTYAGAKGGLGALGLVKDARASLEEAIAIDPTALAGSAYTSLGSLYYQVPGWPLSFGDDEKAERYLKKALAINPDGIDANFFYGDFLLEQGEEKRAQVYLNKAVKAEPRAGREVADAGRRDEARHLLDMI